MNVLQKIFFSLIFLGLILVSYFFLFHKKKLLTATQNQQLQILLTETQNDPNALVDKYEKDLTLLSLALQEDPTNENLLFYLARTHKNLEHFDEAIKWSQARLEKEGNEDQVWYSLFLIGQAYQEKNDWNNASEWYKKAFSYNSKRAEPLQKIATYYRVNGQNDLAFQFAKQGSSIPYPKDQNFFINPSVYDYQFDEELSIAAYYTPFKAEGFAAVNRLVLNKKVPLEVKDAAYRNMLYYVENLKNTHFKPVLFDLPTVCEGIGGTYHPLNPSILKTENGYKMICRTVNYLRTSQQSYIFPNPNDWYIRTKNFLLHYDTNFNLISQQEIIENLPRERYHWTKIIGLEECRLIPSTEKTMFTCTVCDTGPTAAQICYCSLEKEIPGQAIYVDRLTPIKGPNPNRWEKNWLPFVINNELYTIYSHDPFIINKPVVETGENPVVFKYEPVQDFSRFKGSAGPIPFDEGYLVIVHETIFNHQLNYIHRFLYLDKNFHMKKLSKPFTYQHTGIEFCCGMTMDHSGKHLIMTIGHEDREAYIYFADIDMVRKLLEPLQETPNISKPDFIANE